MIADGLGSLRDCLNEAGLEIQVIDTYIDDPASFDPLSPGLLIVLGGPCGVYQADLYPFLNAEIKILEKRLAADLPTLGVCLGAQMMAKALGREVYPGKQGREAGWHPLTVNEAGLKTPVRHLDKKYTSMAQWHGDTFDLPQGAALLASSEMYRNQVFSWGRNGMALQCHAEINPQIMGGWLVGAAPAAARNEIDIRKLRAQTQEYGATLVRQTALFMREWLAQTGLTEKKESAAHA